MLVYTSGTTGRPKGVVYSPRMMDAQAGNLIETWRWTSDDHALLVLPLHHVHGLINVLHTAFTVGASVESCSSEPSALWGRLLDEKLPQVTVFQAVPTIYQRLLQAPPRQFSGAELRRRLEGVRLMVSGSAALPTPVLENWRDLTGHSLLERYGMTEIGMALGQSLDPAKRTPGWVGRPFPNVATRVDGQTGELLVRGPTVFSRYWRNEAATRESFDQDGFFKTGDIVVVKDGEFKIAGRASADIIKSGGEKISALDVERELLSSPLLSEAVVLGVPDQEWGEIVACMIVPRGDKEKRAIEEAGPLKWVREWMKQRVSKAEVPKKVLLVSQIPKNAMGKVNKKELRKEM
jgi:malonyl-CoA/methylmalonyl-CoA synthetase